MEVSVGEVSSITKLTTSDPPPLDPRWEKNSAAPQKNRKKIMRVALSTALLPTSTRLQAAPLDFVTAPCYTCNKSTAL